MANWRSLISRLTRIIRLLICFWAKFFAPVRIEVMRCRIRRVMFFLLRSAAMRWKLRNPRCLRAFFMRRRRTFGFMTPPPMPRPDITRRMTREPIRPSLDILPILPAALAARPICAAFEAIWAALAASSAGLALASRTPREVISKKAADTASTHRIALLCRKKPATGPALSLRPLDSNGPGHSVCQQGQATCQGLAHPGDAPFVRCAVHSHVDGLAAAAPQDRAADR